MAGDVDLMMVNAQLRDELEPYRDESIEPSTTRMSLAAENEYLASMLAWERAPALPISHWFDPPLAIPSPESLGEDELPTELGRVLDRLRSKDVRLTHTDHLDDRALYRLIYRDILPCCEKMVLLPGKTLQWQCVEDTDTYLRFYAGPVERRRYQEEHDVELPPSEEPKFRRG